MGEDYLMEIVFPHGIIVMMVVFLDDGFRGWPCLGHGGSTKVFRHAGVELVI